MVESLPAADAPSAPTAPDLTTKAGRERHWPITHTCCDMTWQATTEDKFLCSQMLTAEGAGRLLKVIEEPPESTTFVILADFVDGNDVGMVE